jgi:hypothetical protein
MYECVITHPPTHPPTHMHALCKQLNSRNETMRSRLQTAQTPAYLYHSLPKHVQQVAMYFDLCKMRAI